MAEKEIKVSITGDAKALISAAQESIKSIKTLSATKASGDNLDGLTKSAEKAQAALKKTGSAAKSGMKQVEDSADGASSSLDGLAKKITMVGKAVAASFVVGKVLEFGKAALSASADLELLHKGLAFSLGDTGADELIRTMQALGEASAYDTTELLPMARAWVNIGDNAEQAAAKMATIIDAGSAYGMTADKLGAVNLALTQMQMKGKVSAEEMMQLTEAGLPAWTLLSEKMGLPVAALQDMASKSELTQEAMDTLFAAMKDKTEGAASSMASTMTGQWDNVQEALTNSMAAIGDILAVGFDVSGVLTSLGDIAESAKAHLISIRDAAKSVGVGQAITDELYEINPALGAVSEMAQTVFGTVKNLVTENSGAIGELVVIIGSIAGTAKVWNMTATAIAAVKEGMIAAKVAALAFQAACAANPVLLAISLIVAAIALIVYNWDTVKATAIATFDAIQNACSRVADFYCYAAQRVMNAIMDAVTTATEWITSKFKAALDTVTGWWNDLKSAFSSGVETTVTVNKHENSTPSGGKGYAKGGVFGMASGGVVGGLVPLANGGQLKKGTPAVVGEAGPEAVIPLKDNVLSKIGQSILSAYQKGQAGGSSKEILDIQTKIETLADTGEVSVYAQKLQEAQEKAAQVGAELAKFRDYQQQCNEEAAKYADGGEATLAYQRQLLTNQQQIAALQEKINAGTADAGSEQKLALLQAQHDKIVSNYETEKQAAISTAQQAADARVAIETNALNAIKAIQTGAADSVYSHQSALEQAQAQQKLANQQADYESYMEIMAAKDEITGQSYATTLANEQYLNEQRAIWNEQMMLSAVEWGTYMQTTLANMSVQLQNGLANGLAQCLVYGENFKQTMAQLGQQLLKTLIQDVMKKVLVNLGLIKKTGVAAINAQTAAAGGLATTYAAAAVAAYITTHPFSAGGAAAIVSEQMGSASGAAKAISSAALLDAKTRSATPMAKGGIVTDTTIAMVGEGRYDEVVIPLKPGILSRLYGETVTGGGRSMSVTQNIYGDINSGSDENDLFDELNGLLAEGMRS